MGFDETEMSDGSEDTRLADVMADARRDCEAAE